MEELYKELSPSALEFLYSSSVEFFPFTRAFFQCNLSFLPLNMLLYDKYLKTR